VRGGSILFPHDRRESSSHLGCIVLEPHEGKSDALPAGLILAVGASNIRMAQDDAIGIDGVEMTVKGLAKWM
jgi:hypothetical protein